MARKRPGGGTPATLALDRSGVAYAVRAYEHDPAAGSYGLEAAQALGVEPERVLKTLLVEGEAGLGVGIVPVVAQLDLKAMATELGMKRVSMADPRVAERTTGYVVGGISPLGQRKRLPTVLDASALRYAAVLVSGGKRGLDLELSPADLVAATDARVADIARAHR
ncbi:aminoacyl-tRNA deacylase [Serinicoccus chungangensis]|uniref:Cys-tRNA(Pro)/Cys-tRNA(Cys) deacylase n=1 Tax=Serinicoccus chungangensis TaxID=767452 RepID=A0A0W8I717_9MICO|nr:Cys-tRNA(Pro) deacylase [Serinicoccus chungangensis]KUG54379.1 aminoacyl-tRNA deacylase [Serinicoccus chungangensis]